MTETANPYKRFFRLAGSTVVTACLALVAWQIYRYAPELGAVLSRKGVVPLLAVSGAVYALVFAILAVVWHLLLTRVFGGRARFRDAYAVYARTSIGKYLPGNVGHVVGRQVMGKTKGIAQASIAGASVMEIVCQTCAAGMIFLWADLPFETNIPPWVYVASSLILLLLVPVAVIGVGRRRNIEALADRSFRTLYGWLCAACFLDMGFFLFTGSLLYVLAAGAGLDMHLGLPAVVAVYSISWFLGLVTPGAPAGAGVREAVIISMLGLTMDHSQALAVAVLFRIMTTAGDVLFFGTGFLPWFRTAGRPAN